MTRDQIIAKWNALSPRERDAWVARDVMGWRKVSRPGGGGGYIGWADEDGSIVAIESDCTMSSGPQDWFRPSQDIRSAWALVDKSAEWGGMQIGCYGKPNARYYEVCTYTDTHPYSYPIDVTRETAPEAICLAAIIAKLAQAAV